MNEHEKIIVDASRTHEGKKILTCDQAFEIHEAHAIPLKEIGEICNRQEIKLRKCRLGCF